jgi:hypothetical protein
MPSKLPVAAENTSDPKDKKVVLSKTNQKSK